MNKSGRRKEKENSTFIKYHPSRSGGWDHLDLSDVRVGKGERQPQMENGDISIKRKGATFQVYITPEQYH